MLTLRAYNARHYLTTSGEYRWNTTNGMSIERSICHECIIKSLILVVCLSCHTNRSRPSQDTAPFTGPSYFPIALEWTREKLAFYESLGFDSSIGCFQYYNIQIYFWILFTKEKAVRSKTDPSVETFSHRAA